MRGHEARSPNPLEIVWHSLPGARARSEVTQCHKHLPSPPHPTGHAGARTSMLPRAARASETSPPQQMLDRRAKPRPEPLTASLSPRYDEGSGGSGDEGRDEAHKREWNLFYQKQMSLRKVKAPWGHRCPLLTSWPLSGAGLGAVLPWRRCLSGSSCHLPGQRPQDRRICAPG